MIITIECAVTGFTKPPNPDDVHYTVWDSYESFRIADLTYVQTPDCGYDYTGVYEYTGLNDYISIDSSDNG